MEKANAEFPPFPDYTVQHRRRCTPRSSSPRPDRSTGRRSPAPGATRAQSTPEIGERYLEAGVRSTLAVLENIEKTFKAMPPR